MSQSWKNDRRWIVNAAIAGSLLLLTFVLMAASDVAAVSTRVYWNLLVLLYGAVGLVLAWMQVGDPAGRGRRIATNVAHWAGVLAAVNLIFLLVWSGRMANADLGLASGAVVALGSYAAGVRGQWLLLIVGVAVAGATAVTAFVEQYVWVLIGIGILSVLAVSMVSRLRGRSPVSAE